MAFLEGYCTTPFWDYNLTWNTTSPDFTQCFQSTFLVFIPCGIFLLLAPIEFRLAFKSKRWKNKWCIRSLLKLILNIVLVLLACINAACQIYLYHKNLSENSISNIVSSILEMATLVLLSAFSIYVRLKGLDVPKVLSIFWLLQFLSLLVRFYSSFLQEVRDTVRYESEPVAYTGVTVTRIAFCLVFIQLILSCLKDTSSNSYQSFTDEVEVEEDNCQVKKNSIFSWVLFTWMYRVLLQGAKQKLDFQTVPPLCKTMTSAVVCEEFDVAFGKSEIGRDVLDAENEVYCEVSTPTKCSKSSLILILIKTAWWPFLISAVTEIAYIGFNLLPPFFLGFMLNFVQTSEEQWHGYIYAVGFYLCISIKSVLDNVCQYFSLVASIRIKSSLTSAVYKKLFRLSSAARKQYMAGEIVNLMAVDTQEIFEFTYFAADFWGIPLRIGAIIYFLWRILGYSSFSTFGVIAVMIPVSLIVGKNADRLQTLLMARKDDRMKEMSEILNGIKVLKLYAWENPFMKRVLGIRDQELRVLRAGCIIEAFFAFLWMTCPLLIALTCFTTYSLSDASHVLDPEKIFVSFSFISLLRVPMGRLPDLITRLIRANVSLGRLRNFLFADELDPFVVGKHPKQGDAIAIEDATLSWSAESEATLHHINFNIAKGSLIAVVGSTGCGKSSLFSAILGDMKKFSGSINVEGSIGYVAQLAWIQNATLQNNILFTQFYKESRYQKVLDACALKPDLELLPGGDKAEIGEKGINLSGGQKQRVSLARAVYQDVDIYLMDDPLSAVDAHVASHIFNEVIGPNGFLRDKTRVLATHSIAFLSQVDTVVVMDEGTVIEQGTYQMLMDKKGHLYNFLQQHSNQNEEEKPKEEEMKVVFPKRQLSRMQSNLEEPWIRENDGQRLTDDEGMEYGRVSLKIYKEYLATVGIPIIVIAIVAFAGCASSEIGSGLWLSYGNTSSTSVFLGVYGGLIGMNALMSMVSYTILFYGSIIAAAKIHNNLLTAIMKSPLSFFDTTPMGRILNRFSKDIETMDLEIPWALGNWVATIFFFFPLFLVIIMSASPYILIAVAPAVVIYILILRIYMRTSNQLRRLDSVSKSPVYTNFSETLSGVSSIRAFGVEDYFINRSNKRMDDNLKFYYYSESSQRWLDSTLAIISGFIILTVALMSVLGRGTIEAGLLGLVLNYCLEISDGMAWLVKLTANLETRVVSLERISEYSHLLPEADWEKPECKPASSWPEKGALQFDNFSITYREGLDPVLKDICLNIRPSTKVGIVGRTGAGKSSLILSLFRIMEPLRGKIEIDGINISDIGLHDLRSKLTVIPQDPILFAGTLRMNLDPWEECSDEEIWKSLERAHLKEFVSGLSSGLNHFVTEGGENLSAGQRQLVCLSRALLRHTKILILDEATASVDLDTDQLIQATIREAFATCTIITIAHRLHTIMDYNRIIVLSDGHVVEDGSPELLRRNPVSHFYRMAKDAGLV